VTGPDAAGVRQTVRRRAEDWDDDEFDLPGYEVRHVDGANAAKEYTCPDCGNVVAEGEAHVVVWPVGDRDLRRHWHSHCWRLEVRRSNAAS
jgi:hypothetical protein